MGKYNKLPYSKKKYITIITIAIVIFFLGFGCLICAGILSEYDVNSTIVTIVGLSFLPVMIGDLIFLFYHSNGLSNYEMENEKEIHKYVTYKKIDYVNVDVLSNLKDRKFKSIKNNFYYKRKFNFYRDFINLYIKISQSDDVNQSIKKWNQTTKAHTDLKLNKCFILFIEKEDVTVEDLEILVNQSLIYPYLRVYPRVDYNVSIVVLIDKNNKCAYYPVPKKRPLIYISGENVIKKLLK